MQNYQDTELMSEDIDLIQVIKKSKKAVNKWKKTILYFLIFGLLGGIAYYFIIPPRYKSRMIVASTLLKGPTFVVVLEDLQRHLNENNYGEVGKLLSIDSVSASHINEIKVSSVKNFAEKELSSVITMEESSNEEDANSAEFIIEVYVEDGKLLKPLEAGLVDYLNNNPYIKQKSLEKKRNLLSMKNRVHNELIGLDSLKNSLSGIYSAKKKGEGRNLSINDPSAIYSNIISLYQNELSVETELNVPDISVVQGFIPFRKPSFPKIGASILSGLFISLGLALLFIFYKEMSGQFRDV